MDAHLITKIIHMSAVSLLILVFVARAATLFIGLRDNQQPNTSSSKAIVGLQHLSLTLIIVTGAVLVYMKNFQVEPWFYAKVILFFVLWSSMIKMYKKDDTVLLVQRRAGLYEKLPSRAVVLCQSHPIFCTLVFDDQNV